MSLAVIACRIGRILPRSISEITPKRTVVGKPDFTYNDHYRGEFDYNDHNRYPRRMSKIKEEELLDDISSIMNRKMEPSPFHVVRRINTMVGAPWWQKVILRRLNLHSRASCDHEIIPNTPQFNALLAKVKSFISVKPAVFEDGSFIKEGDIGSIRICFETGRITKDDRLRANASRLCPEKPFLFRGKHLRFQLAREHRFC